MIQYRISDLIDNRPDEGVFRVNRAMFDDPGIFELEMRRIFESGWVFLGLAAQAPNPHDFFTTWAGRVPILVTRDGKGELHAVVNSCAHKGAQVAQLRQGNSKVHVCPYHSWTYDSAGRNKAIKWKSAGCYSAKFDDDSHDLAPLPAFADYRGLLFGSLSSDVPSLADYLGEAAKAIDLVVDQGEDGVELVPGGVTFTFEGNWKFQLENCSDQYHFASTHPSFLHIAGERLKAANDSTIRAAFDEGVDESINGGSYSYAYGHALNWGYNSISEAVPLFERAERLAALHGEAKRNWIFNMRNLTIFPNLQLAETASSQLRVIRPLGPGKTEMRTWCMAPKNESPAARRQRIRLYEDFFNPSGLATPDDTVCYEGCQRGAAGKVNPWLQGYARGMTISAVGSNGPSSSIGMTPERNVLSDGQVCDETLYQSYYREWMRRMAGELQP